MRVWTTLLGTDDYLPAVLILEESRQRVQSKYPLVVICFDDLDYNTYNTLDLKNIPYQVFPRKSFNGPKRNKDYSCTIGKFYSYIIDKASQFFFIDADSYFVENIDYLFELPELTVFYFDFQKEDHEVKDDIKMHKNVSSIIGCIFGDKCSQERFQDAIKYSEVFREDEQVLRIFAVQYYCFRIDYQDWTLGNKMVLFHEDAYGTEWKFWNLDSFNPDTFLDEQNELWKHYKNNDASPTRYIY